MSKIHRTKMPCPLCGGKGCNDCKDGFVQVEMDEGQFDAEGLCGHCVFDYESCPLPSEQRSEVDEGEEIPPMLYCAWFIDKGGEE